MSTNLEAAAHDRRCERVSASLHRTGASRPLALAKRTSNLFRPRAAVDAPGLDVAGLDGVISINDRERTAAGEGHEGPKGNGMRRRALR